MEGGWKPTRVKYYAGKTAPPAITDDLNDGYQVSDIWIDETNDLIYELVDETVGAAVWKRLSGSATDHTQGTDTALGTVGTKNPPIDADLVISRDSTASNVLVTSTWTQVKAFLKTYFDTLYNLYVHPNHSGEVTSAADGAQTITNKQTMSATAPITLSNTPTVVAAAAPVIAIPAATNAIAGHATAVHIQAIEANTAKVTNATHTGDVTGDGALTIVSMAGKYIYRADGTDVPIADGGTGQSTAQTAINALTAVSGATAEHVLTKDTDTGNAIFKLNPSALAYEEGDWTPVLSFGGASVGITYTSAIGKYIMIGKMVVATAYIGLSNKGSSTGTAEITGMTYAGTSAIAFPVVLELFNVTFANAFQGQLYTSTIALWEITEGGTASDLQDTDFANNSVIVVTAVYFIP